MQTDLHIPAIAILSIAAACAPPADGGEVVVIERARKLSQLVGETDRQTGKPTLNRTISSCGIFGTDLGYSFRHKDRTWFLFGDTKGVHGGDAIAWTTDEDPEAGLRLEFIRGADGLYKPISIPGISQGDFEVPVAGVSADGKMYVYHTTDHSAERTMGRCVLAVSENDGQTFKYLYDVSRDHFINVAIVPCDGNGCAAATARNGGDLFIFGSGEYRKSNVRLARQPARDIENREAIRFFTGLDEAGMPKWSKAEGDSVDLFNQPTVGELSVSYNRRLERWIMLYNAAPPMRGINMRTARYPWGPWSEPTIIFQPWMDGGYGRFIHASRAFGGTDNLHDPGRENEWGGEYGPYQLAEMTRQEGEGTAVYFTMSSWNPYTVVLMKVIIGIKGVDTGGVFERK
ncbi:MAG TPA: DUF4185 domain-containing protein [Candidatus Brocadiia bacterium]|nr:DUF4185 domain-containing protein [Candidatus Brocadiia bacterium]